MNSSTFKLKNVCFVLSILMVIILIFISMRMPFIYQNRFYLSVTIGYFLLALWFFFYLIYGIGVDENRLKNKPKPLVFIWVLFMPMIIGGCLGSCLPSITHLYPSSFTLQEYKVKEVRLFHRKLMSRLGKVHVVSLDNQPHSFYLNKDKLTKVNIKEGDQLVVSGRSNMFGFLILEINGVDVR